MATSNRRKKSALWNFLLSSLWTATMLVVVTTRAETREQKCRGVQGTINDFRNWVNAFEDLHWKLANGLTRLTCRKDRPGVAAKYLPDAKMQREQLQGYKASLENFRQAGCEMGELEFEYKVAQRAQHVIDNLGVGLAFCSGKLVSGSNLDWPTPEEVLTKYGRTSKFLYSSVSHSAEVEDLVLYLKEREESFPGHNDRKASIGLFNRDDEYRYKQGNYLEGLVKMKEEMHCVFDWTLIARLNDPNFERTSPFLSEVLDRYYQNNLIKADLQPAGCQ